MSTSRKGVQAVILDWAGTSLDYGCQAPTRVFQEVFAKIGLPITDRQAREPMGRAKRDHIAAILEMPAVRDRWAAKFGIAPADADVERLYRLFLPLQKDILAQHCDLIPGAAEFSALCKAQNIKIGSSTGYTRELMDVVEPLAAQQGYAPDCTLCADDVPKGRPAPWMILTAAQRLGVYPIRELVVVDDTPVGIEAGHNAGCWTVAVIKSSNEIGLTERQVAGLSESELQKKLEPVNAKFARLKTHYIIDTVANLWDTIGRIDRRIEAGERP